MKSLVSALSLLAFVGAVALPSVAMAQDTSGAPAASDTAPAKTKKAHKAAHKSHKKAKKTEGAPS